MEDGRTIEAGRIQYYVYVTTSAGIILNITNAVEDLGWEENDKELSCRISFTMFNARYQGRKLNSYIKIGNLVTIKANWTGYGARTVVTGYIKETEKDTTRSAETFRITAYDCLFNMQKSQDSVYFAEGKKTKEALKAIFKDWSLKIDRYTGPDVQHSKILYKNKSIADIVLGILDEAAKKGGPKAVIRASGNKVSILELGTNAEVYHFDSSNCIEAKYKVSITSMVTRVKIIASDKDSDEQRVEATVDGKTKYGILQKIQTHAQSDDISDAKKAAREILDEHGSPAVTRTVQAPDVPCIYKGDRVYIHAGSLDNYYIVKSIQHNAATGKMSMEVEYTKVADDLGGISKAKGVVKDPRKGTKNTHYKCTAKNGLPLRDDANSKGEVITTIPYGETVEYSNKKTGNWMNVVYGEETGWAYGKWLEKV